MPELKKTEMCLKKDGIRISISFDKGDEEASTGIAVSPEQIPQYFRVPPDMACTVPARR
jgi:hypothetical protein